MKSRNAQKWPDSRIMYRLIRNPSTHRLGELIGFDWLEVLAILPARIRQVTIEPTGEPDTKEEDTYLVVDNRYVVRDSTGAICELWEEDMFLAVNELYEYRVEGERIPSHVPKLKAKIAEEQRETNKGLN